MISPSPAAGPPPSSTLPYAASGLLAAAAGIGVGHLVAGFLAPGASPVAAVGATVIDATPKPLKEWAISTFGTADKLVLVGSVLAVTLALAGVAGWLGRRRRTLGLLLLAGLGALAVAAALSRPARGSLDMLPGLLTAVTGLATFSVLAGRADRVAAAAAAAEVDPLAGQFGSARRGFLTAAAGFGAMAAAGGAAGQWLARGTTSPAEAIALPKPVTPLPVLPAGLEVSHPGIAPLVTATQGFYRIDTALVIPRISTSDWSLTIDGDVASPVTIRWDELLRMPMIEADITLCCVSNPVGGEYIGNARWLGVRTRDLLARARPGSTVDQILSTSEDGMTISTPLQALTDDRNALLAVAMNGKPLTPLHGAPVRLVTPGLYGFVGATKWITRMTATTFAARPAYWSVRGWAEKCPIVTQSRIDTPKNGARTTPDSEGLVTIGGVAWAQHTGITGVQVRVDSGPWQDATLGPDAGIDCWRQWFLRWKPSPGRHTIAVRATDASGATQAEAVTDVAPKGATGWHTISVEA